LLELTYYGLAAQAMDENVRPLGIDLFAGAGGFSLAAVESDIEIKFAIESDKHSATTYANNICKYDGGKSTTIYQQDILTCDVLQLKEEHFAERECDLLLGGPPCQGFSTHRICNAGVNDPRNELIMAYFSFVQALMPRVFLLENVPGILWDRHENYLRRFYFEGRALGYHLFEPVTLDSRDYGVPQRRRRVFILGIRPDIEWERLAWPPPATHADPRLKLPQRKPWVNCAAAFECTSASDVNDIHMYHSSALVEAFKNTPANGGSRKDSGRILPCHKEHDGHKDVYGRINPNEPAPTMTTACINPSKGRFVHPTEHHGITVRQAARIQTFPDDFVFHGGLTAAGKQIGNAVPVELGKVLINHLRPLLSSVAETADLQDEQLLIATLNEPQYA
jgi:DNA (cytosine-5)-methyltransferase 1